MDQPTSFAGPSRLDLGDAGYLETLLGIDAAPLFELVATNRAHLRAWLPWVDATQSAADSAEHLARCAEEMERGKALHYAIRSAGALCGVISLHINPMHRTAFMGIWLAAEHQGRGLASRAVRLLCSYGLDVLLLGRVEYAAASDNIASLAVARRAGFTFEGTLRNREFLNGRHVDHDVYSQVRPPRPLSGDPDPGCDAGSYEAGDLASGCDADSNEE